MASTILEAIRSKSTCVRGALSSETIINEPGPPLLATGAIFSFRCTLIVSESKYLGNSMSTDSVSGGRRIASMPVARAARC